MSSIPASRRATLWSAWAVRHGRILWIAALLLAVPATWRTVSLYAHLRTELEELLPRDAPSVRAISELRERVAGIQHLGVVVDTGAADNLPAAERMIDDLAARVRGYPKDLVRDVRIGSAAERSFLREHAPLYMDLDDLRAIRARVEARRDWEVSKETGTLLEEGPAPSVDLSDIQSRYDRQAQSGRGVLGYERFSSRELHLTLMLVETAGFDTGRARGSELLDRVKRDLASLGGVEHYARGMRVGFAGDIAISIEEADALRQDLSISSVLVVLVVGAVVVLYYQWWPSCLVLIAPLALATVYAFALASLPPFSIHELNSNTAFLGGIIVGNGVNFGIVLLARYVEERRRGSSEAHAMADAVEGSRAGTLAASLAAAVSYGSLVVTEFRGFRQFGVIGGLGMVLSWGTAFLLVPSLCTWLDRGSVLRAPRAFTLMPLARLIGRASTPLAGLVLVLTAMAAMRVSHFGATDLETDFSKLRRADTWTRGEGYWGHRMDGLLQTYLTPIVVLADDETTAIRIGKDLKAAIHEAPLDGMVATVRTARDVLPADPDGQDRGS